MLNYAGTPTNGEDEVQLITPGGTVTGGHWHITFSGQTTAELAWNATAATVQAALEALSNVGEGNIAVTGGPLNVGPFTLTFVVSLGGTNVDEVTLTSSLTGTLPTITASTDNAGVTGTYRGAPHNMELADTTGGIFYVNSGTASTPVWVVQTVPPAFPTNVLTDSPDTAYADVTHMPEGANSYTFGPVTT
jgi:hypothetical protein